MPARTVRSSRPRHLLRGSTTDGADGLSDTQELLVLTAERLFAERGIGSVSLREIVIESGQRNKSAANYHFGNKQGLINSILAYRMGPIDARRQEMLAAKDGRGSGDDPRGLLEVLVYPFAERLGAENGKSWYARFIAQVALSSGEDPFVATRSRGLALVIGRLERRLAHLPVELRAVRIWATFGLAVQTFAEQERRLCAGQRTLPTSLVTAHLIDELEGIFAAPLSASTDLQMRLLQTRP
jgi:AcrR family transcriptional regulator